MIRVYCKDGCPECERVKKLLRDNGIEIEVHDLEYHLEHHDDWRENGSVELASYCHFVGINSVELPVILVEGEYYDPQSGVERLLGDKPRQRKECTDGVCRL